MTDAWDDAQAEVGPWWGGWIVYFVTMIGDHDPYAVAYQWPLTLTLERFAELQLRQTQRIAHGHG